MIYGVEAQDPIIAATPGSGYTASAVHFDGAVQGGGPTYLNCPSLSCGTDNGFFSFSLWVLGLLDPLNGSSYFWVTDPSGAYDPYFTRVSAVNTQLQWVLSAGVYIDTWETGLPPYTTWTHLLGSCDTNHGAGSKVQVIYANDVLLTPQNISDTGGSTIAALNGKPFTFGDDTFGDGPTVDVADVWFAPNVALHVGSTIPEATRRQFTDFDTGIGCIPIDPAFFPTSAVLFTGNAASFPTNYGTGGAFTLTGSLTNAATHP